MSGNTKKYSIQGTDFETQFESDATDKAVELYKQSKDTQIILLNGNYYKKVNKLYIVGDLFLRDAFNAIATAKMMAKATNQRVAIYEDNGKPYGLVDRRGVLASA